ncbi:hypothetical protein ACFQV2_27250 [Actinokineospora soli]|uniref:Uncharacterized protein n=1 Tax=Actinokineospora soli TaxID=1048753 RepID=A0ABW2TSY9_9PSEU
MRLRRIALGAACAALLVPGVAAQAQPPAPAPAPEVCAPAGATSDEHTDDAACVAVDVALSHAPKIGVRPSCTWRCGRRPRPGRSGWRCACPPGWSGTGRPRGCR